MGEICKITYWENTVAQLLKKSVSVAIATFSSSGNLLEANEAMCALLNTNLKELSPTNYFVNPTFDTLSNKPDGLVFNGLLTIGNYNDVSYVLNATINKKDDVLLVFSEVDIKHLFDENRKMSELNREVNNLQRQLIKEKKKLQLTLDELKETQQQLVHSEKMNAMGHLVAGVAHELNNPLSFVTNNIFMLGNYSNEIIASYQKVEQALVENSNTELLEKYRRIKAQDEIEYLAEDIPEIIKETKQGISRATKIVEDLRTFSRLNESEIKQINLIENINSTLSILRSEIQKKEIVFSFQYKNELNLNCYPGQLNQAILNVLVNAIYAVSKNGTIDLYVEEADENVTIAIKDNGRGIAKEDLQKIFNPFFTTKPVGTGTGLGLSITFKIINDLHKGSVEVKSELNEGTEVVFVVPKQITK